MDGPARERSLTLCICTMDRSDILRRCLDSIAASKEPPDAVLVSDDGADGAVAAMCREYPRVSYFQGPRKGLCANRNFVIGQAATTHVSLMDDDAVLDENFIGRARQVIADLPEQVIITGIVKEEDLPVVPMNPTFWGHFGKQPSLRLENINLNCNIFPRRAFDYALFDEHIVYGYEDTDLCAQLLYRGFEIRFEPSLQNTHLPPKRSAATDRKRFHGTRSARFYTSVKRYMLWKRSYGVLLAYLLLAPMHRALSDVKHGFWFDLKLVIPDMVAAVQGSLRERAKLKRNSGEAVHAPLRPRT